MGAFPLRSFTCALGLVAAFGARGQGLTVYDDALRNGFQDWSYGGGTNFASTGTVHSGTNAISFDQSSYSSAISFAHPGGPLTVAQYPTLHFWVHGGVTGGQKLRVVLQLSGTIVASGALDTYIAGGTIAAGTWSEVTVGFGSAPLSCSGSFDRIDLEGNVGTPQGILYVDDASLMPSAANAIVIEHDVTVSSLVSDRFTWQDASGQPRVAVLAQTTGALREFRYQLPGNVTRVAGVTQTGNGASGGFGYVVSHRADGTTGIAADDSPLGFGFPGSYQRVFEGRHHVIFRFTQLYPRYSSTTANSPNTLYNVPVTIDWVLSTGRDNPLWALTWDLSGIAVNQLNDDSRAPYGELLFDGAATDGSASVVAGVGWGDGYKFASTTSPVTLSSAWTWNVANTVPYVKLWTTVDATMGTVQTQTITQQDAGGYWGIGRWNTTSAAGNACAAGAEYPGSPAHLMPCTFNWPYQSINYSLSGLGGTTSNTRLAWGTEFGFLGQAQYVINGSMYYGGPNADATAPGWPRKSYSTYVVLGQHSAGPVEAQVAQVETVQSLTLSASTGSVVTSGPAGVGRSDAVTYAPPAYNPVYGALAFTASGNALDANIAVGAGTLKKPLLIVGGYTASYPVVMLGGAVLTQDADYFPSLRPGASELWITLNRDLTGATNHLQILPSGTPAAGLRFHSLAPCRLYDTRNASGPDAGAPSFAPGETRIPAIAGRCGVPSTAAALSVNVTAVTPAAQGVLTIYPADLGAAPGTSNLSYAPGRTRANNSILAMAAGGGGVKVYNNSTGSVDVLIDVNGWFE